MLTDIFFVVVGAIFSMLAFVLSPLNWVIPPSFLSSALYLINYLNYFGGIIDLPILGYCLQSLIGFEIVFYTYKLVLFLIHLTPILGNPTNPTTAKK